MNQNYNRIPCFVEKNPKTTIKICGISKQSLWFSIASTSSSSLFSLPNFESPYFPKLSNNLLTFPNSLKISLFPNSPLFNHPKSHHHDQNQQEFKIQTNKVPLSVPILNALFIQNHLLILPP
jgi:hypothetical protein